MYMEKKEVLKWVARADEHREENIWFTMEISVWCGWEAEASETALAFQCQIVAEKAWTEEQRW